MKQSTLRISILALWSASFATCVIAYLEIHSRRPAVASDAEAFDAIKSMTSLWLPVLGCLTAFWFGHQRTRIAAKAHVVPVDKYAPAILITVLYLGLVAGILIWVAYGAAYSGPEYTGPNLPKNLSFGGQVQTVIQWAGTLSPIGTAPAIWLAEGGNKGAPATPKSPNKRRPVRSRQVVEDGDHGPTS
ncbi:MAG TPA: hypothetical protein VHC69_10035 [Polyangiaceae bacterium]|nr:hypothetical protein [Polyangiaceae bacterium]